MEQRHSSGKSHWYHETQSSTAEHDVLPLVPEAAQVTDPFLLDVILDEETLDPFHSWLIPARALAVELFPNQLAVTRLQTFTAYERLSTALTVAQVCGVQRLCNYYSARLTPLPGPDSSRESNHRLAQITQYARQLAGSPSIIDNRSRQHLHDVGLTAWDCVIINQIIGFVGFQARAIATFQAYLGQPVRWLPGLDVQSYADSSLFAEVSTGWRACYEGEKFSGEQETNALLLPGSELRQLAAILNLHPASFSLFVALLSSPLVTTKSSHQLAALLSARINGSAACFTSLIHSTFEYKEAISILCQGENEINQWADCHFVERATVQAIQWLTRAPDRFSAAQFSPLLEHETSSAQVINLLVWSGFCGWINRLKIALGETH
ncbi:CMD domain-containing protein [Escherichia marmotae]|uniref:CMD domain-containing protein n=1 Tax=Escherichia marmotae TaxID=1499973 RepID=UPI001F1A4765|nr:CMD domain-containing protein [Escherichia marmotae]MCE5375718.1 CMD domain-containing protein [Escherichia marmotae]MDQ9239804.1 CMD domain-containing protein [Escherichia marmotae]MDQ9273571.1 CMD domain-containing protein [Escherichia marmotae]MEC9824330.1 CMD domain-containing protein [Escherichia marmotae]MEC9831913.1 CMD domain-containing protein [Escherichia marmotae]